MKRILLLVLSLLAASSLYAAASQLGAALDMTMVVDGRTVGDGGTGSGNASSLDWTFQPSLIIKLDSSTQLEPIIGFIYHGESNSNTAVIPNFGNYNSIRFYFGAGLYTFPAKVDHFSFGTGAKLIIGRHDYFSADLDIPLIIELEISPNVHIRFTQTIAGIGYTLNSTGSGATLDQTGRFTLTTFYTNFQPYFGFSFYF